MGIESIPVSSIMSRSVITETEDQNVQAISKTMYEKDIGSVVIVKNKGSDNGTGNRATGIVTERDIVRVLGSLQPALLNVPIREIMSKPLITLSDNSSVRDALQTMQLRNIRRVVIIERQEPQEMIGIITDKDIFRNMMRNQDLIPNLLGDELLVQHKSIHDQFSEYWFRDILDRRA
jgi:CBS domain-containing protein